jgi:hypothetical protein
MPHLVYVDTLANHQGSDPETVECFDSRLEEMMDRSLSTIDEACAREEGVEQMYLESMLVDAIESHDYGTRETMVADDENNSRTADQYYEIYSGGRSPVIINPSGVEVSPADMFTDETPIGKGGDKKRNGRKLCAIFLVLLLVAIGIIVVIAGTKRGAKSGSAINQAVQEDNTVSSGGPDEESAEAEASLANDTEQDSSPENGSDTTTEDFEDSTGEMEEVDGGLSTDSTPPKGPLESLLTVAPSPSPTKSPSECLVEVITDKSCFSLQDTVSVSFQQCDPRGDDWVGIYQAGSYPLFLGENYFEWSWSCGDKTCQEESMKNTIEINSIPPGWYQAFLVMDSSYGAPYHSVASSDPFRITQNQCPDS